MQINHLDHLVLTVNDIEATCNFYATVLGMTIIIFDEDRKALQFGDQKINLHQVNHEVKPNALNATPGSSDLCFITTTPLDEIIAQLQGQHIPIELGPVQRTGTLSPLTSIYIRDPDGNLIELSNYTPV